MSIVYLAMMLLKRVGSLRSKGKISETVSRDKRLIFPSLHRGRFRARFQGRPSRRQYYSTLTYRLSNGEIQEVFCFLATKCPRRAILSTDLVKQPPWKSVVFAMQQADPVKSAAASAISWQQMQCSLWVVWLLHSERWYQAVLPTEAKLQCRCPQQLQQLRQLPFTSKFRFQLVFAILRPAPWHAPGRPPALHFHLDIGIVKESLHYQCH